MLYESSERSSETYIGSVQAELARGSGIAVFQQIQTASIFVGFADGAGGLGECRDTAQEAAVGLVAPRHRTEPFPAVTTQQVEAAVVTGAGEGVGGDAIGIDGFVRLLGP